MRNLKTNFFVHRVHCLIFPPEGSKKLSTISFHISSFFAYLTHLLKFPSSMSSGIIIFREYMKLSLHMVCGHQIFFAAWIQAPRNFFCRVSLLSQHAFPVYLQVLLSIKSSISRMLRNQCWACSFMMWHSWTSSILISSILLIDVSWNALTFLKILFVMLQDLAPHSSVFMGPLMYLQYLTLDLMSLHEKKSYNIPIWAFAFWFWLVLLFPLLKSVVMYIGAQVFEGHGEGGVVFSIAE